MLALLVHLKVLGYLMAGFASARAWFHKEIMAAKAAAVKVEDAVVSEAKKIL